MAKLSHVGSLEHENADLLHASELACSAKIEQALQVQYQISRLNNDVMYLKDASTADKIDAVLKQFKQLDVQIRMT